ncbi:hypothetical protein [Pseudotabrizicola sp. 4114]|uniref:hypothetical protein n=1 Tax=Pseudotabrizicola sp. 4114 TaxID=2817731 RepID=UPI002860EB32|nr:hypothetical protein [Pseudorhodobacter sp. 4114]
MTRLFRTATPTAADYAGLALFAVVYLAALTLVIAPGTFIPRDAPPSLAFSSD